MKPQNIYVGMAPNHDMLVRCVQKVCEEQCVKELMQHFGEWEFRISRNATTNWFCCYIYGEYEATRGLRISSEFQELKAKLEELVEKERFTKDEREAFSDAGEGLSEEA